MTRADRAAASLARRQAQVITRAQLRACGLTDQAIRTRLGRGWLTRIHRGVYVLGSPVGNETVEVAAILACPTACLTGPSGAYLWRMLPYPDRYLEVTVVSPRGSDWRRDGIRAIRRPLVPGEVTRVRGVPVTRPASTLLDLAALAPGLIDRAFDEAVFRKQIDPAALLALLERRPGVRGSRSLRELVQDELAGNRSRLEGEKRMKSLIHSAGLPMPSINSPLPALGGIRPDMLWRSERVVVEFDGFDTHRDRRSFENDRARDARLQAAGYRVIRVTWRQLTRRPHEVIARLSAVLALAGEHR